MFLMNGKETGVGFEKFEVVDFYFLLVWIRTRAEPLRSVGKRGNHTFYKWE